MAWLRPILLGLLVVVSICSYSRAAGRAVFVVSGDPCATDSDGDGTVDCEDGCPNDNAKIAPGICGCGVPDTDSDLDGTADCIDACPLDPLKIAAGSCGCGVADTDSDADATPDCIDACPDDPLKIDAGVCGCGVADTDSDGDGTADCDDLCPTDPDKVAPGVCGCGVADTDSDEDGTPNCTDGCPDDPLKIAAGVCGCGVADTDGDGDGTADCGDLCPTDPAKITPGSCGCGVADTDGDGDGTANCIDGCPTDPAKITPGLCGCGSVEVLHTYYRDADGDGFGTPTTTVQACTPPAGFVIPSGDCNDDNASICPGATEVCGNQIDDDCDSLIDEAPAVLERIRVENALAGTPKPEWEIVDSGDPSIQGYATKMSVRTGETIDFKIKTDSPAYSIQIYRVGWYGGMGARRVAEFTPTISLPQIQPDCITEPASGLVDCGNWQVSASWFVPCEATSGVYFARLMRQDPGHSGEASHIHFVVRDDQSRSDILVQTSDTTWQAYNSYGGTSLYRDFVFNSPQHRAYKVSYNRPFNTRAVISGLGGRSFFFNAEYPLIRWLERNGFDVSYTSGLDTATRPAELLEHKVFVSSGHDEYWSGSQRRNVESARAAGVHLAFFSGNAIFWKTRWEPSLADPSQPNRTLTCFKETAANAKIDPLPGVWTGTWRDPRFSPPNDGRRPENALKGTIFSVNGERNDAIRVPSADGKLRLWRGTTVATLGPEQSALLSTGTLGYEWDEDLDNGFRPAGLMRLSTTVIDVSPGYIADYGNTYGAGFGTHSITLYKHYSGALVFSAGTIQWAWGLDDTHDRGPSVIDERMQQATVNLFADMDVQPASLQAGLVKASRSTDTLQPYVIVQSPREAEIIPSCDAVTITGVAADVGGGRVAGVEVSVDNGATWHPANGRESWTYTWMPEVPGLRQFRVRAVDDSGNILSTPKVVNVERRLLPSCDEMIFGPGAKPHNIITGEVLPVELGVKFQASTNGLVRGVRFFQPSMNPGGYSVHLWTSTGTRLAVAAFTGGPRRGWQQVLFTTPVPILANTTYVASYHCPGGSFAYDPGYFATQGHHNGQHLRALSNSVALGNGVYKYGATAFPNASFGAANYWCDVVFESTP